MRGLGGGWWRCVRACAKCLQPPWVQPLLQGLLHRPWRCGCLSDCASGPAREMRDTNGLLREELEGLQRRLGRQEKMQETLVDLELEKEVSWSPWVSCGWLGETLGVLVLHSSCSAKMWQPLG